MLSRVVGAASARSRTAASSQGLQELTKVFGSTSISPGLMNSLESISCDKQQIRCFASRSGGGKKFRPRRFAGPNYRKRGPKPMKNPPKKAKGPKEPNDVTRRVPQIDMSKIKITDSPSGDDDEDEEDGFELFDPFPSTVLQMIREGKDEHFDDIETQLRLMDYYTSEPGSTEDLVGQRRALAMGMLDKEDGDAYLEDIEKQIDEIRIQNLRLPKTDAVTKEELEQEEAGGLDNQIPPNQLAHGDW